MSTFAQFDQTVSSEYVCIDHFMPLGYNYDWVLPYVSSLNKGLILLGDGWHGRVLRLTEEERKHHEELLGAARAFLTYMSKNLNVGVSSLASPRLVVNEGMGGLSGGNFHRDGIDRKSRAMTVLLTEGPPTHFKEEGGASSCHPDKERGSATLFKNAVHRTPKPRSELGRVVLAFDFSYRPLEGERLPEDLIGYGFNEREIALAEHWSSIQSGNLSPMVTRSKKTKKQYYDYSKK